MREKNICEVAGIQHRKSFYNIPNPVVQFSELTSDEQSDLQDQIFILNREMHKKFLILHSRLYESLKKNITVDALVLTLLLDCKAYSDDSRNESLFKEHRKELCSAKEMGDVFKIILPYCSYYNYELIETITEVHGSDDDKKRMQQYLSDFSEYCKKVPCVEVHDDDNFKASSKRTKVKFKLDYKKEELKHGDIKYIQIKIAMILGIQPSVLFLCCIQDGCVIITFLVPAFITEHFLNLQEDMKRDLKQEIKLISEPVICDDLLTPLVCRFYTYIYMILH